MINLIITVFGVVLIILGFYSMSFGFSTPPDIKFFLIGLFSTVTGVALVIFFGGQIKKDSIKSPAPSLPKKGQDTKGTEERITSKAIPKEIKPKPSKTIKEPSATVQKPKENIKKLVTSEKPSENVPKPRKITPKKITREDVKKPESPVTETKEKIITPQKDIKKPQTPKKVLGEKQPVSMEKPVQRDIKRPKASVIKKEPEKTVTEEDRPKEKKEKIKLPSVMERNGKYMSKPLSRDEEDEFVKNRLDRLKENYIKNAKDIENLIEERLDSFKGTLNQIKSESKDPSIIWSFDAGDVQETMQETILKANEKILMMYPWVRNIEVSALKKFMETESRMIIQEASLDDDASVELIKLLMDNNVKIRTMPHVHTVAIVADAENGLIISTDPIYESFEVGVIYKDIKSIEEIERMFNEAWKLSKDINLEIK